VGFSVSSRMLVYCGFSFSQDQKLRQRIAASNSLLEHALLTAKDHLTLQSGQDTPFVCSGFPSQVTTEYLILASSVLLVHGCNFLASSCLFASGPPLVSLCANGAAHQAK
jgi:hypothetical protein